MVYMDFHLPIGTIMNHEEYTARAERGLSYSSALIRDAVYAGYAVGFAANCKLLDGSLSLRFPKDSSLPYGQLLTNQRQEEAARRALDSVMRAREALDLGVTPDALLTDVEEALAALGELTGQSVREDITDRIFARFCVGK